MNSCYIYVLKNLKGNKSYIGFTTKDPTCRLKEHNAGSSRLTKKHRPWQLIYQESVNSIANAREREKFLKSGHGREYLKKIVWFAL